MGDQSGQPAARGGLPRHHAQADLALVAVPGRLALRDGARERFEGRRGVIALDLQHQIKKTSRSPSRVRVELIGSSLVGAERDSESQRATDDDDQILKNAMMLLPDGPLTFLDECMNRRKVGRPFEQESAESFSRRIKPRRVIETSDEWEQFGEREAHWARDSTVCSEGVWRPGAGSTVTRTPTIERGTSGGRSVASVARPEASGAMVPALTGSAAVKSQI